MSKIKLDVNTNTTGNINVRGDTKKNTKITISIGSLVIIAIVILIWFSMSNNVEKKIIGTWQNSENAELYITFLDNNNVSLTDNTGTLDGTYIFTGDNSIKINLQAFILEYSITADISIKNNTLNFDNVNDNFESGSWLGGGNTTSFKKVK